MTTMTAPPATEAAPRARRGAPFPGASLLLKFLEALAAGLVAGFVLVILAPVVLGWRPYTVLTGSMRPVIQPGDVVMDQPVPIGEVHVGQIVTFSDPTRGGKLVTHRVRSISRGADQTQVETRGDANNTSERWSIKSTDRVGSVRYLIPKVGRVATVIRSPLGILLVIVIPVLGIGAGVIRRIWQEEDADEGDLDEDEPEVDPEVDQNR